MVLVFISSPVILFSQSKKNTDTTEDYYSETYLRYDNHTYQKNIQSVLLINKAAELSSPMIRFGTDDQLRLSFDDLNGNFQSYHYTVIHCNADWQPSDLMYNEYVNGFDDNSISDYEASSSLSIQKYTHYSLYFPNSNLIFLKPGNYLLKVYMENQPDNLVITRRFMIYENDVTMETSFKSGSSLTSAYTRQGVNLDLKYPAVDVRSPDDIKVCLLQNDRWDNAQCGIQPTYQKDHEQIFESTNGDMEFNGGSEFRNFDTKTLKSRSMHLSSITVEDNHTHVSLTTDETRNRPQYVFDNDLNGNFLIKNQDGSNSDVDADYCYVNFFLSYPNAEAEANIYVTGVLTDWQLDNRNKMKYNKVRHGYECTLYLKQGYYNYEYVMLSDGKNVADEAPIEGSHAETENSYTILVYYRPPAQNYDKLIGVKKINSTKN